MPGDFFETLVRELPSLLTRKDMGKYFGSLISPRYLANLDCLGKGPRRTRIGQKVVYRREDVVEWLQAREQPLPAN